MKYRISPKARRLDIGWKAEWLKKGGCKMSKSLVDIFTGVKEEREISKPWREAVIKSIYTGGKPICVS